MGARSSGKWSVDLAAVPDDAHHGMSIVVILLNMAERLQLCQGRKELDIGRSSSLELQAGTVVTYHILSEARVRFLRRQCLTIMAEEKGSHNGIC